MSVCVCVQYSTSYCIVVWRECLLLEGTSIPNLTSRKLNFNESMGFQVILNKIKLTVTSVEWKKKNVWNEYGKAGTFLKNQ